jgi:mono/diheme cytochrome c family protein
MVGQTTVESTWAYSTAANVPTQNPAFPMDRIEPGNPNASAVIQRQLRNPSAGDTDQMPPLGREIVDDAGVAEVAAWISSLAH